MVLLNGVAFYNIAKLNMYEYRGVVQFDDTGNIWRCRMILRYVKFINHHIDSHIFD
jgi:hypothetical protein